jgi:hypothetical protein
MSYMHSVQYLNMYSNDINGVYIRVNRRNTMSTRRQRHVAHPYLVRIPYHHSIASLNNALYGGLHPSLRVRWEKVRMRINSCGLILFKLLMNDVERLIDTDHLGTSSTVAGLSASDISTSYRWQLRTAHQATLFFFSKKQDG